MQTTRVQLEQQQNTAAIKHKNHKITKSLQSVSPTAVSTDSSAQCGELKFLLCKDSTKNEDSFKNIKQER